MLLLENNKVESLDDVFQLKFLKEMYYLDLTQNPVTQIEGYREKVFEALPNLMALDGKDKDGGSVDIVDDDDYGAEDGELEIEDFEERLAALDPELRKRYEAGEMDMDEMRDLGLLPDFEIVDAEEGGEEELEEDAAADGDGELGKRERDGDDAQNNDGKKAQKTD